MLNKIAVLLAFLPVALSCTNVVIYGDQPCISSYAELTSLEAARGNNNAVPVTYIICPNTVFNLTGEFEWNLNGNTNYVCGYDGASTNNCVVTGGEFQFTVSLFPYNFSSKDNIVISGFTFEKAAIASGAIASSGNFEICDCIFKVRKNKQWFHETIHFLI